MSDCFFHAKPKSSPGPLSSREGSHKRHLLGLPSPLWPERLHSRRNFRRFYSFLTGGGVVKWLSVAFVAYRREIGKSQILKSRFPFPEPRKPQKLGRSPRILTWWSALILFSHSV